DGYTQAGASVNTLAQGDNAVLRVELDGSHLANQVPGLLITGGGITLRGLDVHGFDFDQIQIYSSGAPVEGNFLGAHVSGTVALSGGFGTDGIDVPGSNNRIGTNGDGVNDLAERNLISGNNNGGYGLNIFGVNNVVAGNYIGTDASGTHALGNYFGVVTYSVS